MLTLNDLLLDSASYLDLNIDLPTGDELDTRIRFANQGILEWEASYQWRQLKSDVIASHNCDDTLSLPTNFKNLVSSPQVMTSNGWDKYPEIPVEERYSRSATDKYSYILGNEVIGYTITFNGLSVNSTVALTYQRHASLMATLTDKCEVPDPEFIKLKMISYVLQSRNDERFPIVDAESKRILKNMIGRETIRVPGGYNITPRLETYRIG